MSVARRQLEQRARRTLAWCLAGFVAVQLGLAVGLECRWPATRDPEFADAAERLRQRCAEAPDRPLVLVLGSSRTQMGLRADRLSEEAGGPLVFNFAIPGAGPMTQQVVLRRLLARGYRPQAIFLEVMPMSLSRRGGTPLEERQLDTARLRLAEILRLRRYFARADKLWGRWLGARLLPCYRHQAELSAGFGAAIGLTVAPATEEVSSTDGHGWRAYAEPVTPEKRERGIRFTLGQYESALNDSIPAPEPTRALRELLALCRRKGLPTTLVIPPECSALRAHYNAGHTAIDTQVRELAQECDVPLVDARAWVGDDGFWDGHHLCVPGADQYTERFGREALRPLLQRPASGVAWER